VPSVPVPRTWTTGEVVTAAFLNGVRDALNFILTPPLFVGRQTVVQTAANLAWTGVTWDVEDTDTAGGHSTVTNTSRYTGQYPGWYSIESNIDWAANAAGFRSIAWRTNGGTTFGKTQIPTISGVDCAEGTAGTVFLNGSTDYVETIIFQNSGGNLNTSRTDGDPRTQVCWLSN
jgi:hypothetical protein